MIPMPLLNSPISASYAYNRPPFCLQSLNETWAMKVSLIQSKQFFSPSKKSYLSVLQGLLLLLLPHLINSLHICPTFPYCALQPSGLWSSLPLVFKSPVQVLPVFRVRLDKPLIVKANPITLLPGAPWTSCALLLLLLVLRFILLPLNNKECGQKKNGIMWGKFPSGGPPPPS